MTASILVADDEPGIRELLAWELASQGYEVTTATDGAQALEQLKHAEFDLLISDVRMPRVDGLQVLRTAKTKAPDTEVIIATGYAELEYAVECVRQGAFDLLQKPFHIADLLSTVSRALERRRLRGAAGLYEASRAILTGQEPPRLPELIVRLAMEAMNADDASLMLPNADGGLYVAHSHSMTADVNAHVSAPIAARVAAIGEAMILPGADPRISDLAPICVGSSIVYPLLAGKRLTGVLTIHRLSNERPFRKHDLERAAILASQVLLALENARLVRQLVSTERLASVGLLASAVAHEINNPTACVLANHRFVEQHLPGLEEVGRLFDSGADPASLASAWQALGGAEFLSDLREVLGDLGDAGARIRDIVRDMRSLARNDQSPAVVFDLDDAIRSALRIASGELKHRVVVKTELARGLDVLGSPGRISQIFVNLLVNAAQALGESPGDHEHEIRIRSERRGDDIVASVSDNGPGIRPEHLGRIFETFFTTKSAALGTGLGLVISREIAQSHGGDLRVESEWGRGATFILTLPFAGATS